jgi:hypothetical protein
MRLNQEGRVLEIFSDDEDSELFSEDENEQTDLKKQSIFSRKGKGNTKSSIFNRNSQKSTNKRNSLTKNRKMDLRLERNIAAKMRKMTELGEVKDLGRKVK